VRDLEQRIGRAEVRDDQAEIDLPDRPIDIPEDFEEYANLVPTGENIALMAWERLRGPLGGKLARVVVDETRNNRFEHPPAVPTEPASRA